MTIIRLPPFRLSTGKLRWESNVRAVKGKEDVNMTEEWANASLFFHRERERT